MRPLNKKTQTNEIIQSFKRKIETGYLLTTSDTLIFFSEASKTKDTLLYDVYASVVNYVLCVEI